MSAATAVPLRVLEANLRRWRRTWKGNLFTAFVSPALYLAAMGLGLGTLVDRGGGTAALGGATYVQFVGAGLLAATAFQNGANDSSYPVMLGLKWGRTYHAMIATPVNVADIILGHLGAVAIRLLATSTVFAAVMVAFGVTGILPAIAAVPFAVLTGLAVSPAVAAYTARADKDQAIAYLFRFVIVPVFLLSGAFFPIDRLPDAAQVLAWITPLWHGVELTRAVALDLAPAAPWAVHVAYLGVWAAAGTLLAIRALRRRLVP